MFPQHIDLEFHQIRLWSSRLKDLPGKPRQVPTIDDVVNAHARVRWGANELAAWNLTVILNSVRRRGGDVRARLEALAAHPNTLITPEKRAALSRKWLERMSRA